MNEQKFIKNLKLKGTSLDRSRKLSEEDITKINQLYATGNYSMSKIANKYDVTEACIWRVLNIDKIKSKDALRKKLEYYNQDVTIRASNAKKKMQSTLNYKKQLYNILINNLKI